MARYDQARHLFKSQWNVAPQSAFLWCEKISAYAIGGVAMFWVIQRAAAIW